MSRETKRRIATSRDSRNTPEPWFVTRGNEIGFDYVDANGNRHVGYVAETLRRGEQGRRDARLIAAAPELLAVCKQIVTSYEAGDCTLNYVEYHNAKLAIANAKGSR